MVGNSSERNLLRVASRLEKFRHAFVILFPTYEFNSSVPTRVLVYRDERSFRPVAPRRNGKPVKNLGGYFRRGETANYIVIHTPGAARQNEFLDRLIFHEYTHFLIRNMLQTTPAWLAEGLAEYFSTFPIRERGEKAYLGWPFEDHIHLLRKGRLLPLRVLLGVDHSSPYYNERDKKGIFYAQSWALVSYLNEQMNGRIIPELAGLMASGLRPEEAFEKASGIDLPVLEREFRQQVRSLGIHSPHRITLPVPVRLENSPVTQALSEAEMQYYLGDFLLSSRSAPHEDAERFLQKSIRLDPNLSAAHALLGKIYMQRKEFTEAEKHLTRSAQAAPPSHLAHYYRALLYSLDPSSGAAGGAQSFRFRENYPPETEAKIRAELEEAIRLEPDFPDSYYLLAQITLATNSDPAEAVHLLKQALRLAPGRERYAVLLAEAYVQSRKPQEARRILTPLARTAADRQARHEARRLLKLMEERGSPR